MGQHWEDRDPESHEAFLAYLEGKPLRYQTTFGDVVCFVASALVIVLLFVFAWLSS